MIFVTVGTHHQGFDRLLRTVETAVASMSEEVMAQLGGSRHFPPFDHIFHYCSYEEIVAHYRRARVIVTHAGAGALLLALQMAKPTIVMPRRAEYGEVFDHHQVELTTALAKRRLVTHVETPEELRVALLDTPTPPVYEPTSRLSNALGAVIRDFAGVGPLSKKGNDPEVS